MPTGALKARGADVVIAVHLEPGELHEKPRNTIEVIGRSFSIIQGKYEQPWRKMADVVIEPDVRDVLWDGFAQTPRLIAAGAEATVAALPQIREAIARRSPPEPPATGSA